MGGSSQGVVEERHFEKAFATIKPSVGEKERARYEALKVKYGQGNVDDESVTTSRMSLKIENQKNNMDVEEKEGELGSMLPVNREVDTIEDDLGGGRESNMNGNEIDAGQEKYDAALENPSQSISSDELSISANSGNRLRFLPHMMVMVKDSAMSNESLGSPNKLAGCSGRILSLRHGESLACVTDKSSIESVVQVADLMPELPEEGDLVASLRPEDTCQVGKLESVDDKDQARVAFSAASLEHNETLSTINVSDAEAALSPPELPFSTVLTLPLERLCKVDMT